MGSSMAKRPSFKRLIEKGGQVVFFNPVIHMPFRGRANLRNHRKLLITDSQRAILGGMNIAEEYMGPSPDPHRWTDFPGGEGSSWRIWRSSSPRTGNSRRGGPRPGTPGIGRTGADCQLQVIASGPDVRFDPLYDTLISLIYQATRRIWIATPYFIPDESLTRALELAARRGIEVRILVPRNSNHFLADLARGTFAPAFEIRMPG